MGATRIVAQPATLTGSIGVVAGKPVVAALLERLGVRAETVKGEGHAGMWTVLRAYDASEQERVDAVLDAIYAAFKDGVAAGRGLPPERVEALARGRVWTGAAGRGLGLVDELGGLDRALAVARGLLDLPENVALRVRLMPEPPTPLDRLRQLVEGDVGLVTTLAAALRAATARPGLAQAPAFTLR
jgi:protease-4